jgi:hypothetical protein
VSQTQQPAYEFGGDIPLNPVAAGTSLLVSGPSFAGTHELVMGLLACRDDEGLLLVGTDVNADKAIANLESAGCHYETARMAVVDCTQDSEDNEDRNVHSVSAPGDLTGIGIAFSSLYEQLYSAGFERVRTGLYTLAPLLMFAEDVQPLYRFLHTFTGRIRTAGGLGVAAIDPDAHDETTVRTLSQPFDGELQFRERDGVREIRARGLPDQPDGWQQFGP